MHFLPEKLDDYVVAHSEEEPDLLQQLTRETYQKILQPRMLSGHYQGRLLSMISKLINPKNILEIGTYTGYSALCLAEGMQLGGELHTIDINEELVDFQRKYFDKIPHLVANLWFLTLATMLMKSQFYLNINPKPKRLSIFFSKFQKNLC